MASREEVFNNVLDEQVLPFYYDHPERTFRIGDDNINIADSERLLGRITATGQIEEVEELLKHPVVHPRAGDPIALPGMADFLEKTLTAESLFTDTKNVMATVHEELVGGGFFADQVILQIQSLSGRPAISFIFGTHHFLGPIGYQVGNKAHEFGIFGYSYNNATDYPAQRIMLLSGLGHLASKVTEST